MPCNFIHFCRPAFFWWCFEAFHRNSFNNIFPVDLLVYWSSATMYVVLLWLDGTLKRVVCCFEEGGLVFWRGYMVLQKVMWYFEEFGMVLWRLWCGTLKMVVCYFEKCCMGLCDTLKRVLWFFEEGDLVLCRCCTLNRVVCYFEEGCVVLWRGCTPTFATIMKFFSKSQRFEFYLNRQINFPLSGG